MNHKLTKKIYSICQSRVGENLLSDFMIEKVILNATWICGLFVQLAKIKSVIKWHFLIFKRYLYLAELRYACIFKFWFFKIIVSTLWFFKILNGNLYSSPYGKLFWNWLYAPVCCFSSLVQLFSCWRTLFSCFTIAFFDPHLLLYF